MKNFQRHICAAFFVFLALSASETRAQESLLLSAVSDAAPTAQMINNASNQRSGLNVICPRLGDKAQLTISLVEDAPLNESYKPLYELFRSVGLRSPVARIEGHIYPVQESAHFRYVDLLCHLAQRDGSFGIPSESNAATQWIENVFKFHQFPGAINILNHSVVRVTRVERSRR